MCIVTTFPSQDIIFESQQNEWIKFMCRNKRKAKGQDKSPPSNAIICAMFDSNDLKTNMLKPSNGKPLNRKERKVIVIVDQNSDLSRKWQSPMINKPTRLCYLILMKYMDTSSNKPSMLISLRKYRDNELLTAKLDRARSNEKMDMKLNQDTTWSDYNLLH
jgi:hypothetical protein